MNASNEVLKTPQRGRSLYPSHLAKDENQARVPLHRRGKSKTYERLEDLLREAGYKETRVFTPEAERLEAQTQADDQRPKDKGRRARASAVGGVVNFLAGLVWSENGVSGTGTPTRTQSLGRAQGKEIAKRRQSGNDSPTPSPRTKAVRRPFTPVIITSDFSSPSSSHGESSTSSLSPPLRGHFARDAQTTLRHMISAPDIPQRPHSTQPIRRLSEATTRTTSRHRHTQSHNQTLEPPLPTNWLQTVAQAVMGAGPNSGVYVGGPASRGRAARSHNVVQTQVLPTEMRRNASASSSASRRTVAPRTPSARVLSTPGVVTAASVVCRSAPGSRSSSVVRGKGKDRTGASATRVPSLGVTSVEVKDESFAGILFAPSPKHQSHTRVLHLNSESDGESDEEGEPDFAALLVPARRQHSIRSLRRHLHNAPVADPAGTVRPSSSLGHSHNVIAHAKPKAGLPQKRPGSSSAASSVRRTLQRSDTESVIAHDIGDDSFEAGLARDLERSRRGSVDEDVESLAEWAARGLPSLDGTLRKKRAAMPLTWGRS